jgi:colanic acid biosynthesis protein WcaH
MEIHEELYNQIVASMPIVCVDLLVRKTSGQILLVKRRNRPAKNQWWFPGGRVLFNEKLSDAVRRKAKQECGLSLPETLNEKGAFELLFSEGGSRYHSVTFLFECIVDDAITTSLDFQSSSYIWIDQVSLSNYQLHEFIMNSIKLK